MGGQWRSHRPLPCSLAAANAASDQSETGKDADGALTVEAVSLLRHLGERLHRPAPAIELPRRRQALRPVQRGRLPVDRQQRAPVPAHPRSLRRRDQGPGGAARGVSAPSIAVENLDGSRTEYFDVDPTEATLLALARELFEEHWEQVIFGPCIEGAVFEGRFSERPRLSLLDGYLTVEVEGGGSWHFHVCIGPHHGTPACPPR